MSDRSAMPLLVVLAAIAGLLTILMLTPPRHGDTVPSDGTSRPTPGTMYLTNTPTICAEDDPCWHGVTYTLSGTR